MYRNLIQKTHAKSVKDNKKKGAKLFALLGQMGTDVAQDVINCGCGTSEVLGEVKVHGPIQYNFIKEPPHLQD